MSGDATTIVGIGLALTLLILLALRAFSGTPQPLHGRLSTLINVVIVALLVAFLIIAGIRFVELSVPRSAPTPGPNPPRAEKVLQAWAFGEGPGAAR